jgi:hypothetical protein
MTTNEKLSRRLHKEIIDRILNSSLNLEMVPDDLEREIYERIFTTIEDTLYRENIFCTCWNYVKRKCSELFASPTTSS